MQTQEEQLQIADTWLREICPKNIIQGNHELAPQDTTRIGAYIRQNFNGQITYESLNAAVVALWTQLTHVSNSVEGSQFRGAYAPAQRQLSDQAKRDAGLAVQKDPRTNHHLEDQKQMKFETPQDLARHILQNVFQKAGMENPMKAEAEALVFQGDHGIDHRRTGELRQIFVKDQAGNVLWDRTLAMRKQALEGWNRARNQRQMFSGRSK
jgi:hypothetical protein